MSEFRIVNPEPRLANYLGSRKPIVVPQPVYDWAVDWVDDVGTVMRDRRYIITQGAMMGTRLLLYFLLLGG